MEAFKAEFKALLESKAAWFLLGMFFAQNDMPGVVAAMRGFIGF